jgi:hypothetical protein
MADLSLSAERVGSSHPRGVLILVFSGLLLMLGGLCVLGFVTHTALVAAAAMLGAVACLVLFVALRRRFAAAERGSKLGTLRVADGELFWRGEKVFASGAIREAMAYTNGSHHGVRVSSRRHSEYFELGSPEEADRVVTALGKDSRGAAVNVGGQAVALGGFSSIGVQAIRLVHSTLSGLLLAVGFMAVPILLWLATRTRWVVGSDGLLVKRGISRGRFIPYRNVVGVEVRGARLRVAVRDGKLAELVSVDDSADSRVPRVGVHALARRIAQARDAARLRGQYDLAVSLGRGERNTKAWMADLLSLLRRPTGYRVATVSRDQLWGTLEDVAQPAEMRAAAAVALRPALADEERRRLRVAAEACASPRLRVAFEVAAGEDERSLEDAIEEIEKDANRRAT